MIYGTPRIILGDVRESLRAMPADSVHCVVTSPPYWGLRSYLPAGHADKGFEIGSEPTPEAFVETMVDVFREVRRVLHPSGVMGLNIGDSYNASPNQRSVSDAAGAKQASNQGSVNAPSRHTPGLKPKDLMLMPWRVFMALQAEGWYVRSIIVWHKPAPMPESCTDRPTSAWEPIALMSKRPDYFWDADAIREPLAAASVQRQGYGYQNMYGGIIEANHHVESRTREDAKSYTADDLPSGANSRNVWRIASEPWADPAGVDHFAAFPTEIPRRFVKAGTSERGCCPACLNPWERITERTVKSSAFKTRKDSSVDVPGSPMYRAGSHNSGLAQNADTEIRTTGWRPTCGCGEQPIPCTVLDPFSGTGSTGVAACQLGRNYIGCELFEKYAEMSKRRISQALNPNTFAHQGDEAPIEGGLFQ